jgi:glutathione S-transferase
MMLVKSMNLDIEIITLNLGAGDQNKPEFLKLNPRHQVPVLVDDDFVLTESRAILSYLVNKYQPGESLYPSDPKQRAVVDQRLYFDATVVFEAGANIIVS